MPETEILVVRIGSMGDVIHALPAVASLKHGFPGCSLSWIIHPRWVPLLEGNPFVDRVIQFNRRSMASVREAWRALRSRKFEFAVDFQGLVQSALVASVARPDRIIGFHQSQVRERPAALFYSKRVRATCAHVVDRNLELAAACGAASLLQKFPLPPGWPEGDLPESGFVLACPVAGWSSKQWPAEYYDTLAQRLKRELGLDLVLNVPPGSSALLDGLRHVRRHVSGIPGLIYAIRKATAFVGTDSGPTHLAAALRKPGAAIFGPTNPDRNGPYGGSLTVLRSPRASTTYKRHSVISDSMRDISPQLVFEAVKSSVLAAKAADREL